MPKCSIKARGPRHHNKATDLYSSELGVFQWLFEAIAWLIANAVVMTIKTAGNILRSILACRK